MNIYFLLANKKYMHYDIHNRRYYNKIWKNSKLEIYLIFLVESVLQLLVIDYDNNLLFFLFIYWNCLMKFNIKIKQIVNKIETT